MFTCPNCGKTNPSETRQCPKHGGLPVCIMCCKTCDTYDVGMFRCTWHTVNKTIVIDDEVKRLKHKIIYLEREAKRQYNKDKPRKGNLLLNEEKSCRAKLKQLEQLRKQGFTYI